VVDFGIRGFDLAHALQDAAYDAAILVDASPQGGEPGTLYVIEPQVDALDASDPLDGDSVIETHGMDPARVLRLARALGAYPRRVLVVGCEPTPLSEDDLEAGCMGLSPPARAAVEPAVGLIESLLADLLGPSIHLSNKAVVHP
jgi:hydrogenase maturation protease